MKAVRLYETGGPENLKIEDVAEPKPGPLEVLVKVAAVGICGHDQSDRQGLTRPHIGLPFTSGHEIAGTVVGFGDKVVGFAVGDRVATKQQTHCGQCTNCRIGREMQCEKGRQFNYGGWAEYVALPAPGLLKVPDNIDLLYASVVACTVGTTLNALRNIGEVQPGENVLITGAGGGLGLHGMQVAKALGARAIALTSSPSKVDQLRAAGADDVVVAEGRDYWEAIVKATNGGPQVVLDNVGHPDVFSPIFRSLARHARYVFTGQLYREKIDFYPAFLFGKETQLRGAGPGSMSDFADSLKLVSEGKVTPIIEAMPLVEAVEANRKLDAREIFGRGVLVPLVVDTADVTREVRATVQRWLDATVSRDVVVLDALITADFTFTHATSGNVDPRDVWLESFRSGARNYRAFVVTEETYRVYPGIVLLQGTGHQEMGGPDVWRELNTHFLCVWVNKDNGWKCATWQATQIVPH